MKKTEEEHNLIVLGAGASIGSDREPFGNFFQKSFKKMPSSDNYFYDINVSQDEERPDRPYLNWLPMFHENVYQMITYVYDLRKNSAKKGYFPEEWKGINLESVFTFFDVNTQMLHKNTEYNKVFEVCKECLIDFFITDFLMRCEGQYCKYLQMVFNKLSSNDNIISFNWDTIADITLEKTLPTQFKNYLDLISDNKINIQKYIADGNFLKLHGSINWMYCNNKKCKNYNKIIIPKDKNDILQTSIFKISEDCQCCKKRLEHLVIPPSSNKLLNKNQMIHKLWLLARMKLFYAKKIIFIGYSFPPNDYVSDWLFRHVYLSKKFHETHQLPEIIVVNPEIKKPNSLVSKRYKSIFPNVKIKKFATLEEFCDTGLDLID